MYCHWHPKVETGLRCSECERAICIDCGVTAAVGIKCKECGRVPKAALARVPLLNVARGAAAGVILGMLAGFLFLEFRQSVGFFSLIVAYGIGIGVAEGVRRASGGYKDATVAMVAALSAFVGVVWPSVLHQVNHNILSVERMAFPIIAALFAAFAAYRRDS